MNNITINEKQALEILKVNSFREISKEKILDFMSMLPSVGPEVVEKALEQFPHYATSAGKAVGDYKEVTDKAIESADTNLAAAMQGRLITIDSLSKMLENEDLTFEQKMNAAEFMADLSNQNSDDARQNDEFKLNTLRLFASLIFAVLGVTATVLGGRFRLIV